MSVRVIRETSIGLEKVVSYVLDQCPPLRLAVTSGHQFSLRAGLRGLQRKTQLRGRVRDK